MNIIDRAAIAWIDLQGRPRAPIPSHWVDRAIFVLGVCVGAGLFRP